MSRLSNYSTAAASNNKPAPIQPPEGMDYRLFNDVIRQFMSDMSYMRSEREVPNVSLKTLSADFDFYMPYAGLAEVFLGNRENLLFRAHGASKTAGGKFTAAGNAARQSTLKDMMGALHPAGAIQPGGLHRVIYDYSNSDAFVAGGNDVRRPLHTITGISGDTLASTLTGQIALSTGAADAVVLDSASVAIGAWLMAARVEVGSGGLLTIKGSSDDAVQWSDGVFTSGILTRTFSNSQTVKLTKISSRTRLRSAGFSPTVRYHPALWIGEVYD